MTTSPTIMNRRAVTHLNDGDKSSCKGAEIYAVSQFRNKFWSEIKANVSCFYTSCCVYLTKKLGPSAISPTMLKVYMAAAENKIKASGYDKDYLLKLMREHKYIKGRTGRFFAVHQKLLEKFGVKVNFAFLSGVKVFEEMRQQNPFVLSIPTTVGGHVVVAWLESDYLRILDSYGYFDINKMSYVPDSLQRAAEYSIHKTEFQALLNSRSKEGVNILYED